MKNGKILLVDDEVDFYDAIKFSLPDDFAYDIKHVKIGREALEIIKNDSEIDLILLDLILNDGSDPERLINEIYSIRPKIKIIIVTAYPDSMPSDKAERLRLENYLVKPFNIQSFNFAINKAMSEIREDDYESKYICINDVYLLDVFEQDTGILLDFNGEINRKNVNTLIEKVYGGYVERLNSDKDIYKGVVGFSIYSISDLDSLLFLSGKRYRDHYKHQFRVGLLGSYMLESEIAKDGERFKTHLKNIGLSKGMSDDELFLSWWICALLHDALYPISHLLKSANQFRMVKEKVSCDIDHLESVFDKMMSIYSGYADGELYKALIVSAEKDNRESIVQLVDSGLSILFDSTMAHDNQQKSRLLEGYDSVYDHGVLCAASMALKFGKKRMNRVIKLALRAIALHNNNKNLLDFDEEPMAALLVMCDELQEWGREIIINGISYIELHEVCLMMNVLQKENHRRFPERFTVRFQYNDHNILRLTGWDYAGFIKSKNINMKRLVNNKFFRSAEIEFQTMVPSVIKMS